MLIYLNEIPQQIESGRQLYSLRDQHKPEADILIVNGHPASSDMELNAGDHIVMISRGVQPSATELEGLMMARHTPGVHQKVKGGHIGIAGVGGLGSLVALALARTGIGQLTIADFDIVEPSNLNRQQYFIDQIGQPKVSALGDSLKRINPAIKINCFEQKVTPENIAEIFATVDILVEAFDGADQKAMLSNQFLCLFPDKILVAASGIAGYGASNSIRTTKISDHFYLCGDGITAAEPGCGLMAPRVGIAANHQANAVLRLLLNKEPE
ncbi:sulfur carrier protein ThiS adenylyltransferase [Desulfuromusa kysingii]|uniref:Sulfur carrier protein ThiS adenylyltransferase n=1 Tax=Desulfuromusa kysingii TaxID=37625 RepID=A0A1H3YNI0_9BACT|nr:sulfur carrier protein ThiS adenylyltransferase ThiF [Desulfuromusa kysingii]SEA13053.1 sulfur carrier protein ThiS adenylyltransferase [Desulfuromusa kysingii]